MADKEAEPLFEAPRHVAIIMDGNGRWAAARGLPATVRRWSRLISAGSVTNSSEPVTPSCSFDSTILGCSSASKSNTGSAPSGSRK